MNDKDKELRKTEETNIKPDYFTVMPAVVRYDTRLKANEKILYSEILTLSRKNGYCYASNNYLANLHDVGISVISKWISNLIKFGYLMSENEYKEGTRYILRRKLYPTNVDDILHKSTTYIAHINNNDIGQMNNNHIAQKCKDNNTSINNKNNNKNNNSGATQKNQEIVNDIVDYLNKKAGTDFKPTTEQTKRLIYARLKDGFTYDDFIKVIDVKAKQWKNNPEMSKYLRPQTLFGTKFESYLQEYSPKNSFEQSNDDFDESVRERLQNGRTF